MPLSIVRTMAEGKWNWARPKIDLVSPDLYAPLWRPDMVARGGRIVNGTGICTGSPLHLAVGANTVDVTQAGTLTVYMPEGGSVATGTMTVTGSPVTISAGIATTITTTGAIGNITVTPSNIIRSKDKNNLALTVTGALWTPQGRTFDGIDDKIVIPHSASLAYTGDAYWMFWMTPNIDLTAGIPSIKYFFFKGNSYGLIFSDTAVRFLAFSDQSLNKYQQLDFTGGYLTGVPYHCAISWNNTSQRFLYWVNTVSQPVSPDAPSAIGSNASDLVISGDSTGANNNMPVRLGEFLSGNRQLTISEVRNHYQATRWRHQ